MISREELYNDANNIYTLTYKEVKKGDKILKALDREVKKVAYKGGDLVRLSFFIKPTENTFRYVINKLKRLGYDARVYYNDLGHYIYIFIYSTRTNLLKLKHTLES